MGRWQWIITLFLAAGLVCAAHGQVAVAVEEAAASEAKLVPLVKTDFDVAAWLDKARDRIKEEDYGRAIEILQAIIEGDSGFVAVDESRQRFVAMRAAATDMLGTMGQAGLDRYRQLYNARADRKLSDAIEAGDIGAMNDVAATYLHTPAGQRALDRLGAIHFDRGSFVEAGRYWQRRLDIASPEDKPLLLAKVATALQLAGRTTEARQLAKTLEQQHPDVEADIGGEMQNLAAFAAAMLKREPATSDVVRQLAEGYPGWGGIPDGLGLMSECEFVLLPEWQTVTPATESNIVGDLIASEAVEGVRSSRGQPVDGHLELRDGHVMARRNPQSRSRGNENQLPLPPVVRPVVTDRWVIYRTDARVVALDRQTGEIAWDTWEMLPLERDPGEQTSSNRHVFYGGGRQGFVDQGRYGLTLGGGYAYTIWGFPHDDANMRRHGNNRQEVKASSLTALRLDMEGYAAWTVGYSGTEEALKNAMFLSLPTFQSTGPGSGRLYVMIMESENYYLACLDPYDQGKLLWKVEVAQPPTSSGRMHYSNQMDAMQRIGTPPAIAGGRVFVTTNAGVVAAFQADTGKALWAWQYTDPGNNNSRAMAMLMSGEPRSRVNPILVADGVVLVLPADSSKLYALTADGGALAWNAPLSADGMDSLVAVDGERFLLSGKGIGVYRFSDGKQVKHLLGGRRIMGRPAVTSKYILASGDGLVYRIDKQKYNLERLHLASSNAILGNLVSADGQLYAANMLGVSCYKSYDAAREHLTERINQSEPLLKAELLFKRGHLAFVTRRFDMALADFEACRDIAADLDELQRDSYMAALRPRLYRAYVAMGNVSSDRDRRLEHFEQAMALAEEPGEKGRMLIRLAKHYEDVGQFDKAIEAAQKVSEDFGSIPLEDVGVGPGADTSVTVRETAATHFGRQWSRDYVGRLVRVHGQEIYEPWNARVRERLDQAVATGDPAAIEEVIDAYPHSRHIPEARLRSAEMYYLQARRRTGRAQAEKFGKAQNQLMSVSTADDVSVKASAIVGMVAINVASGATMSAERNLKRAASIPQDTPVSFAGFEGPLGDVAKRVLKNEAPPVPDVTPLSLKKLRDIDANEAYIVADQDGRALTAGNEAFVLEGQLLQIWELDKADKEDYKPRTVDLTVNVHAEAKVSRASPSAAFSASLRAGGKELWLAGGHDVVGVDLAKGEVIKTADLETDGQRAARIVDFAFTSNMLVAVDYAGLIKAINIPDGSLAWISQVETDNRSRSVQLLANDQAVVIVSSQQRDVHVFNAAGGKEIYNSKAEARASAAFTKDGKLLLTRDNAVSLRNVGADTIDKPVAGFVFEDTDTATVIAAGEQYAVLQLDGNDERFVAIPLASLADGKTMELDPKIKIKGKTAQPIGAIVDGPSIYLFGSRSQPRSVSRPGEIRYVQGLTLTKFEMPEAAIAWESTVQVPQRSPVHLASLTVANGNLVLGLRSMSTSPMAYLSVTLDEQGKVTELGILRIDVKKNRQARMRQRYAGVAAVAGNRMLVETPTGLRLYGEK